MEVLFFSLLPPCEPVFKRLVSVRFQHLSMVVERRLTVTARMMVLRDLLSHLKAVSPSNLYSSVLTVSSAAKS